MKDPDWEAVIGLEIHVQLNTKSKLFSRAPNQYGDQPNCNISVACTGQPGSIPILNGQAVRKAVQFGCAVGATVNRHSRFDRKTYFYPDNPKNFQITQFEKPLITGGSVLAEVDGQMKSFEIDHAHIEDDSGMMKHFSGFAGVDYNRAGVPLIEIVSTPTIHSASEAIAYATAIRSIMLYIGASDCSMEKGSLRFDANVSVRKHGESGLRTKMEIKNMNSFRHMELAIESEIKRQVNLYKANPALVMQEATYRFDPESQQNILMRKKEEAQDYLYFPEPDLAPLVLSNDYIEKIRKELPELPDARYKRYTSGYKLDAATAARLIRDKPLSDYFDRAVLSCENPTLIPQLANWVVNEFPGRLKGSLPLPESLIPPSHIAEVVSLISRELITGRNAKLLADLMAFFPEKSPEQILAENPNFLALTNEEELQLIVSKVVHENPLSVQAYKAGKERALAALIGQVMKLSGGKASPERATTLLRSLLSES